jgi:hypothetical protein
MCSVIIIFLTSFSRVYFGVHYPHDVLVGTALGVLTFLHSKYFTLYEYRDDEDIAHIESQGESLPKYLIEYRLCLPYYRRVKYIDNPIFPVLVLVSTSLLMYGITISMFDYKQRKMQFGLFYGLGSIAGSVIFRPSVIYIEQPGNFVLFI